jgi:NAD(P)-dependent dehydrogenase (short-subunit alcohol dehydrogenase family)
MGRRIAMNIDPREVGPKPPFPKQEQTHPGTVKNLNPPADHGEESYVGTGKLRGRAAIVTGADSGIGRAVAIAFAKEGADVLLSYLPEEEPDAAEVIGVIEEAGRKAVKLPGDIRKPEYCQGLVAAALKEFGRLDVVVNNAGFQMTHDKLEDVPLDEVKRTFDTNIFGTFALTQAALKELKPGASILNTTSIQAYQPGENLVAYAATKAAVLSMTKSVAKLAMEQGVRVNAVAPGPVWTPLIPSTMPPEKVEKFGENTVFKRPAQPVELAKLFVFLASDDASYVTGEVFGATGGRTPY